MDDSARDIYRGRVRVTIVWDLEVELEDDLGQSIRTIGWISDPVKVLAHCVPDKALNITIERLLDA